jgi:hypothetical protein
VLRAVQLHAEHYADALKGKPTTIVVGRNPLTISDDRDRGMATIGFLLGATFVVAALEEQGHLGDAP